MTKRNTAMMDAIAFYKEVSKRDNDHIWGIVIRKLESYLPQERKDIEEAYRNGCVDILLGKHTSMTDSEYFTITFNSDDNG